ncbi:MAG: DUF998 domain-containing protein [Acidimicrobiia bacterium]|jgi:hypothetical membrane protein
MAVAETEHRLRSPRSLSGVDLARLSWAGLILSVLMLAFAPLLVADSYSLIENTLSESGGQGVDGAWMLRTGVLLAAFAVFIMTTISPHWGKTARIALRIYVLGLVALAVFPESPWDGGAYDGTVAYLHTVSGVVGAASFIVGVMTVSNSRPSRQRGARAFDWMVVLSVALVPQLMLATTGDGLLQRTMVALGYAWLFVEAARISERLGIAEKPTEATRGDIRWTGDRARSS